jgi:hypothetical protein
VQLAWPLHGLLVGAYMHDEPAQQGVLALQLWPMYEQTPPSVGVGGVPHVPLGAPGAMLQT